MLSDDEYLRERQTLERDRIRLAQNEARQPNRQNWFEPARDVVKLNPDLASRFRAGSPRTRGLLVSFIGSNPRLRDRKLLLDARKPFRRWPKRASRPDMLAYLDDVRTFVLSENSERSLKSLRALLDAESGSLAA
jgi:hypothetical protein